MPSIVISIFLGKAWAAASQAQLIIAYKLGAKGKLPDTVG